MASSRSVSRGRPRSQSHTPPAHRRDSRSSENEAIPSRRSRSRSSRQQDQPLSRSRSLERDHHNGNNHGHRDAGRNRSRSPSRGGRRSYRERSRSYSRSSSRSLSRGRRAQSSKIVVEKLSKNVTEAHLREIFGSYGRIESIDLPLNRQFMTNRGTAYIVYDDATASESAIAHMHEAQLDGTIITVSIVLPRRAFSKSPLPIKPSRPPPSSSRLGGPTRPSYSNRNRSPIPRRGGQSGRPMDWDDPRSNGRDVSRSPTPPPNSHRRNRSFSRSRSLSRTPPRRRGQAARSPPRRRRRSPSYSSYSSDSRSRSRTRTPSRSRYSGRK